MPPTVQSNSREERRSGRSAGASDKKHELVTRVKYNNQLPDIPFDPKFITYRFDANRFVQYNQTSLERNYKYELLTENDLGVTIDLINPDTYRPDPNAYLDYEDERLLEEDINAPTDSKRSRHHNKAVSWLRKTEYISTEYNRFTPSADKVEAKIGYSIKKQLKEEEFYKDRESQIEAIDKTFDAAKLPITQHHTKPNVHPVEVMPVLPDFEMWKHPCAQVIFDTDPAPVGHSSQAQSELMSQAMIRGMVDESGDQFVAYFLPTEETISKRKRDAEQDLDYEEGEEYDYVLAREYNWNVKNKLSRGYEETYFFVQKEDGMYYNELETRVRLSKRRKMGEKGVAPPAKSRLIIKHRPYNEQETGTQDARMMMLEPPGEEEEEIVNVTEAYDGPKSGDEGVASDVGRSPRGSDDEGSVRSVRSAASSRSSRSGSVRSSRSGSVHSGSGSPRSYRSGSASPRSGLSGSGSPGSIRSGSYRSGSGSPRSVRSRSASGSGSGSGSESEAEGQRKAEEEIFGSASSSEED